MIGRETRMLLRHYLEQGTSKSALARQVRVSVENDGAVRVTLPRRAPLRAADEAVGHLGRFARVFPIGRPRALLHRGLVAWTGGRAAGWARSSAAAIPPPRTSPAGSWGRLRPSPVAPAELHPTIRSYDNGPCWCD
jgi:hypothetical protein